MRGCEWSKDVESGLKLNSLQSSEQSGHLQKGVVLARNVGMLC